MYWRVLCGLWTHWIEGPGVAPSGHRCSYQNLLKGHLYCQSRKIQYHDLPSGVDSHRDFRGVLQLEEHRIGGRLSRAPTAAHPISRLWGGFYGRAHDKPFQNIACNRSGGLLGQTTSYPDRTPPPGV